MDVKSEILRRLDAMPADMQYKVLVYLQQLPQSLPTGEKPEAFLLFVGILDDESAREMRDAIEADCERVE